MTSSLFGGVVLLHVNHRCYIASMLSPRIGRIGHVLLVEPEASPRETYRYFLTRAGFTVQTASRAAEAIRRLNDGDRPAVVVTDCELPAIDGVQLLRIINRRWGFIPVVLCAAAMESALRVQLIGQGADACFEKPVDIPKLIAFLRQRMGHKAAECA